MTDQSGITTNTYDNSNRLISDIKSIDGKSFTNTYTYTTGGSLSSITYPGGRTVSYNKDSNGRIINVTETKGGVTHDVITTITYTPNGTVSSISDANGIITTKTYDTRGALNSLNIGTLKQFSYTRDNVGNITAINDLLDLTKTKTYAYDPLYRLTQATGPWGSIQYNYDPVGNRTVETAGAGITNYTHDANKLISSSGAKAFTFSYDNNGNTISENQRQYIYNQNQRLIKAGENGNTLGEYFYNGNGQRVKKVAGGKTTYFIYDQSGNLMEEADEQGQVNADYIYLGSIPIARVDEWWEGIQTPQAPTGVTVTAGDRQLTVSWNVNAEPVDGYKVYWGTESKNYTNTADAGKTTSYTITGLTNRTSYYIAVKTYVDLREPYYYHTDHLGTPIMMTDKNQNVVWDGEFLPFGERYSIDGKITNNFGFPGQYLDVETGLHQNGFRDYRAEVGRYIQFDPLLHPANGPPSFGDIQNVSLPSFESLKEVPQSLNPYIYVGNNSINFSDPRGLSGATGEWSAYPPGYPPGPVCNAYKNCCRRDLYVVCMYAGNNDWSNCVRKCLLDRWHNCKYDHGFWSDHYNCWFKICKKQ